jgi:hypothetical protein
MIPANETRLANLNWKNGTLSHNKWNQWSPAGNDSQPVNLTILSDNIAALQFVADEFQNFGAMFAMARTILSGNYYSGSATCVYPISGSYDLLTRILFYLLLVFALLYRRHTWVAIAALGTAMTYSTTTAVHALALLAQFKWQYGYPNMESSQAYGDPDIWGTYPILLAAVVMTTPILNWSTNVRRHKAQVIMVLWGTLCFVALVPVMVYISSHPDGSMLHPWSANSIPALLLCPRSAAEANPICRPPINYTMETYATCECFDFCGLMGPAAPMRSGAKMVTWLEPQDSNNTWNSKAYSFINYWAQVLAAVIVCYGGFGLLLNQFNLREMRNFVFRLFYTHHNEPIALWRMARKHPNITQLVDSEDKRSGLRKVHFVLAKLAATLLYFLGMLIAFICPIAFVIVIVVVEIDMLQYPHSEDNDAVGAWSTWVGAALVIIVAVILRYQDAWESRIMSCGEWVLRFMGIGTFQQKMKEDKERRTRLWEYMYRQVTTLLVHSKHSIRGTIIAMKLACQEFLDWIRAPAPHSSICGCNRCVSFRALIRQTPIPANHADSCMCKNCADFKQQAEEESKTHNGKPCGCCFCSFKTDQATWKRRQKIATAHRGHCKSCLDRFEAALKTSQSSKDGLDYKDKGYQTLGMRILQRYDKRIRNMLEPMDSMRTHSVTTTSEKTAPVVSVEPKEAGPASLSASVSSQDPLQSRPNASPQSHTTTPVAGSVEQLSTPSALPSATLQTSSGGKP